MKKRTLDPDDSQVAAVAKKSKINEGVNIQPSDETVTSNDDHVDSDAITTESLQQLLDFSHLSDEQSITTRFDVLANALLRDFHLVLKCGKVETSFQIMELEFYLQKAGCHEDPFTHGSEEQKISGRWYFHRAPRHSADSNRSSTSLTEYRSGSRKGLDLTIGSPPLSATTTSDYFAPSSATPSAPGPSAVTTSRGKENPPATRGGILLRSIRKLGANSKVVSGPSLLVDQILSLSGAASIAELVETKLAGDTSAFLPNANPGADTPPVKLYLKHSPPKTQPGSLAGFFTRGESHTSGLKIYNSPRIGLDLSHPGTTGPEIKPLHSRIRFLPRRYRYFTHPSELVANGRSQTFLGVLYSRISSDIDEGLKDRKVLAEIVRLSGMKEGTATKYLADYVAGRAGGAGMLGGFVGPKGKGAGSSPSTYLKMMGALSAL